MKLKFSPFLRAAVAKRILIFLIFLTGIIPTKIYPQTSANSFFHLSFKDSLKLEVLLDGMTLREKCAQVVFPNGYAYHVSDTSSQFLRLKNFVEKEKVGGILFLQGDVDSLPVAVNKLQELSKTPLLISADFENGVGARMDNGVEFPPPMAFAAARDTLLTYLAGYVTAEESRALGVRQNYAPVLDVNTNYLNPIINYRSYSDRPEVVAKYGINFIKGLQNGGVLATAKHFPGHGSTSTDSHNELPVIAKSKRQLLKEDIIPFRKAIKAGVASIMAAHLSIPALDKNAPASLSHNIISGLLRHKLNFKGLVVSDALNMHAITSAYSNEEAAQKAFIAGNDILLFPPDVHAAVEAIYNGVIFGKISRKRLFRSVKKILSAKIKLGLFNDDTLNITKSKNILSDKSHKRLARKAAVKSITLLKNKGNIIPINKTNYSKISVIAFRETDRKDLLAKELPFFKFIKYRLPDANYLTLNKLSKESDFTKAVKLGANSDLVIFPVFIGVQSFSGEITLSQPMRDLIRRINSLSKQTVVAAMGNPYIITDIPNTDAYLTSYGLADVSQAAIVQAMFGEINITGKLPVTIPTTPYKFGDGIKLKRNKLIFPFTSQDSLYNFTSLDSLMNSAISDSVFPGAELVIGKGGTVIYDKTFGRFRYDINSDTVFKNTLYDLASLTKVVATTSAVMLLYDKGLLHLEDKVADYLPQFANHGKDEITIEQLLLHTSGLPAGKRFYYKSRTRNEVLRRIMNMKLISEPGEKYKYSDIGMIVLQQVIEKITRQSLDKFITEQLFNKIGLKHTMYNPSDSLKYKCAPTEIDTYWRMKQVQGTVHDETAALLNGVSGNAGLFSTAEDLAKFAQLLLDKGECCNQQIIKKSTVELFTTKHSESGRAYGWDTKSPKGYSSAGKLFSLNSFGHTGFTGTSIWIDKNRNLFVILLTNRVYPTRKNRKHIKFRPILHDEVIKSVENNFEKILRRAG
jgi:beta-N-acetylhexosaminidase